MPLGPRAKSIKMKLPFCLCFLRCAGKAGNTLIENEKENASCASRPMHSKAPGVSRETVQCVGVGGVTHKYLLSDYNLLIFARNTQPDRGLKSQPTMPTGDGGSVQIKSV